MMLATNGVTNTMQARLGSCVSIYDGRASVVHDVGECVGRGDWLFTGGR